MQIKLGDGCRGNWQTGLQLPSFLCMANVVFRCLSPENPFGRGREDGHFNSRGHKTNFSIGAAARQATNHGSRYAALEKDSRAMGLFFSRFRRVKFSEKIALAICVSFWLSLHQLSVSCTLRHGEQKTENVRRQGSETEQETANFKRTKTDSRSSKSPAELAGSRTTGGRHRHVWYPTCSTTFAAS